MNLDRQMARSLVGFLWRHKSSRRAIVALVFIFLFGLFQSILFSDQQRTFPALVPYQASTISAEKLVAPFSAVDGKPWYYTHWLGTDDIGRDVFAGLASGSRVALQVAFFSALFTLLLGGFMGILSGFFGNHSMRISYWLLGPLVFMMLAFFYSLVYLSWLWTVVFALAFIAILILGSRRSVTKSIAIPWDTFSLKMMELADSIPALLLLLVLLVIFQVQSAWSIAFIIALLRWPSITRYLRAELTVEKQKDYVKSAEIMGLTKTAVLFKHLLPNAMSSTLVSLAFGAGVSILLEASLSFLGLGLSLETVTWGSMLSEARSNFNAWWLVVFPGIALFIVIYSFNVLSDKINEYYQS